jgi:hypothetical protein
MRQPYLNEESRYGLSGGHGFGASRQLIFTAMVMQIGLACDPTTNGSNCHRRTASRIALVKAGKGGVRRGWRMVQTCLTLPFGSISTSPIHTPLPRVPGGSSGYVGVTSRTFFGGRCHSRSIRGFNPTNVAPSRSHTLVVANSGCCAVGSAVASDRPRVTATKNPASRRLVNVPPSSCATGGLLFRPTRRRSGVP